MMTGENIFTGGEEHAATTSNKSPTPDSNLSSPTEQPHASNDHQAEARTVVCSSQEMAQVAKKVEQIKMWTIKNFRMSKQAVLENFNKSEKSVDVEFEKRVSDLHDLHNRYKDVLNAAALYAKNFHDLTNSQKQLAESFYQLSMRDVDLKEKLNEKNEALRQFTQYADEFAKQLGHFVSSLEVVCNKTIQDTILTINACENARLLFDAQRHEIQLLQQQSSDNAAQIETLQQKCNGLQQNYDNLKGDVRVKLALLDENRLKVMNAQLDQFEKSLQKYFTDSIKALAQNSPKAEEDNDNFARGVRNSSFLEQ